MTRVKSEPRRRSGRRTLDVGLVGVGLMGLPMALSLLRREPGARLHLLQGRAQRNLARLPAGRTVRHATLAELAAACRYCLTVLPMPDDVRQVIIGEGDSLRAGFRPGSVVIDCSTSSAELARTIDEELERVGCAGVDSPVSGSPVRAKLGTLSLMVGSRPEVFPRVRRLLECLGTPVYMGPPGAGQTTKSINQIVVGLTIAGLAEGILLGRRAGIDLDAMLEALGGGLAGSEVLRLKGPNMIRGRFEPGFYLRYHLKDLNLAMELAGDLGLAVPFTALFREVLRMGVATGHGLADHSAVLAVLQAANGVCKRPGRGEN